ncbi:MAG: hypothetical protein L0154_29155 [Chloroflexi bacterium]|nr:hypothetical protein [Chloroflexota bacterium]
MIRLLVLVIAFLFVSLSAQAQEEIESLFTPVQDGPVIDRTTHELLDQKYSNPGAMIYHDGQFHMFRNGFSAWPGRVTIVYLTSPDGLGWTVVGDQPVIEKEDVPYAGRLIMASSVLVEDDSTWVLYFYTWDSFTAPIGEGSIGRATATSPEGPWTADPEPLLVAGAEGSWDEQQVGVPSVVKYNSMYYMYYSGFAASGGFEQMRIGLAISEDGIHWTKYDDLETTEPAFAEGDPVFLRTDEGWDFQGVERPRVVVVDDTFYMVYRSRDARAGLGLAISEDGIHWTRPLDIPVSVPTDVSSGQSVWLFALLHHDNTFWLYQELCSPGCSDSDIYLMTKQGDWVE